MFPSRQFTQEEIEETLGVKRIKEDEREASVIEVETDTGPAYLNPYMMLQGNEPNIFIQALPVPPASNKKQITFSDFSLRDRPLSLIELYYFESLIGLKDYFECYFWPGNHIPFMGPQCPMLHSLEDFQNNRKTISPATKQEVVAALGEQGLSKDKMIILDREAMSLVMQRVQEMRVRHRHEYWYEHYTTCLDDDFLKTQLPFVLDLSWYSDLKKLNEVLKCIDPHKITHLKLSTFTSQDFEKLIRFFDQLKTIEIHPSPSNVINHLSSLNKKKVNIILNLRFYAKGNLILPPICVDTVTIKYANKIDLSAVHDAKINNLEILSSSDVDIDLTYLPKLKTLKVEQCKNVRLVADKKTELTELTVTQSEFQEPPNVTVFPRLKRLTYKYNRPATPLFLPDPYKITGTRFEQTCLDIREIDMALEELVFVPPFHSVETVSINLSQYRNLRRVETTSPQSFLLQQDGYEIKKIEDKAASTLPERFFPFAQNIPWYSNLDVYSDRKRWFIWQCTRYVYMSSKDYNSLNWEAESMYVIGSPFSNRSRSSLLSYASCRILKSFTFIDDKSQKNRVKIINFTGCGQLQYIKIVVSYEYPVRIVLTNCSELLVLDVANKHRKGEIIIEGQETCSKLKLSNIYPLNKCDFEPATHSPKYTAEGYESEEEAENDGPNFPSYRYQHKRDGSDFLSLEGNDDDYKLYPNRFACADGPYSGKPLTESKYTAVTISPACETAFRRLAGLGIASGLGGLGYVAYESSGTLFSGMLAGSGSSGAVSGGGGAVGTVTSGSAGAIGGGSGGAGGGVAAGGGSSIGVGALIAAHPIAFGLIVGSVTLPVAVYASWCLYNKYKSASLLHLPDSKDLPQSLGVLQYIDAKTEDTDNPVFSSPPGSRPAESCVVEIYHETDRAFYQTQIFNRIVINNKRIIFRTEYSKAQIPITVKPLSEDIHQELELSKQTPEAHRYLVHYRGKFAPEELHGFPCRYGITKEEEVLTVYCSHPEEVELFCWDPELRHCYFELKSAQEIHFYCYFKKKDPRYERRIADDNYYYPITYQSISRRDPSEFLPEDFIDSFKRRLSMELNNRDQLKNDENIERLKIFLNEANPSAERIQKLYEFFNHFRSNRKLDPAPSEDNDEARMLEIILQYTGVCRHQTWAFNVLCQVYGFDCLCASNGQDHAYPLLLYKNPDGSMYDKLVRLVYTPAAKDKKEASVHHPGALLPKLEDNKKNEPNLAPPRPQVTPAQKYREYYELFKKTVARGTLYSLDKLLDSHSSEQKAQDSKRADDQPIFSPLLCLKAHQDPLAVNTVIVNELRARGIDPLTHHLLITKPSDFEYYLSPGKLDEKGFPTRHSNGPLRKLLTNKGDNVAVLAIDWTDFDEEKKAGYQSILDNPPTLTIGKETFEIPKWVKVIGFTKQTDTIGDAFLSRSKCWDVHDDFFRQRRLEASLLESKVKSKEEPLQEEKKASSEKLKVILNKTSAYEEPIFGELTLEGKEMKHVKGPLFTAIEEERPLTLCDPPDTARFRLLKHQINEEKKWLVPTTGEFMVIPSGSRIEVESQPLVSQQPKNVEIMKEGSEEELKIDHLERIDLRVDNLHECYKYNVIDKKTQTGRTNHTGLLGDYTVGTHIFYIRGAIPLSYWQKLMDEIGNKHAEKCFRFLLAPGALAGSHRNDRPHRYKKREESEESKEDKESLSTVYVSNDTGFLIEELSQEIKKSKGKSPCIIDEVSLKSTFSSLLGKTFQTQEGLDYEIGIILNLLKAGETVILNGEISFPFYQQLQSLLSENPHIYFNGERIKVKEKLILVMPKQVKEKMPHLHYEERNFNFEHYKDKLKNLTEEALIKEKLKKDNLLEQVEQIEQFYKRARKLPHRGSHCPKEPYLSYERLKSILKALQDPKHHSHNPIKGIFNADYLEDSAEYAYLNVVGKAIFRPEDKTSYRLDKLKKLKKLFSITTKEDVKKYVWHLLNCFNGQDLKNILGNNLDEITHEAFPSISEIALEKLCHEVLLGDKNLEGEERKKELTEEEKPKVMEEKKDEPHRLRHDKQMDELRFHLEKKIYPIIVLQGPAGVGKTHAVRELLGKGNYYEGEEGLVAWLESDGSIPFLADEMNMAGDWDFLKGLGRSDKIVYYKRKNEKEYKKYKLGDRHQVIGTCNPVGPQYPGRSFVETLQDLAWTIAFKEPKDDFYRDHVFKPKLQKTLIILRKNITDSKENIDELISRHLLSAYHLIKEYNPHIIRSIRDLENIAERFIVLANKYKPTSETALKRLLLKTCLGEFAMSISDPVKRQEFVQALSKELKLSLPEKPQEKKLIRLTDSIYIPQSKRDFVETIEQDLEMRWQAMLKHAIAKHKAKKAGVPPSSLKTPYYKQSITVEGEPGRGKSTYLRAIVEKHKRALMQRKQELEFRQLASVGLIRGMDSPSARLVKDKHTKSMRLEENKSPFQQERVSRIRLTEEEQIELALLKTELRKKTEKISGGSADPLGALTTAFHQEQILINDESNLNRSADQLISQFLCGADQDSKSMSKAGFMHLGSQNSTAHSGRPDVSKSKQNRDHVVYLDGFSISEQEAFAERKVTHPKEFVRAYEQICTEYPHANMRTFHEVAKQQAIKEASANGMPGIAGIAGASKLRLLSDDKHRRNSSSNNDLHEMDSYSPEFFVS